MIITTVQLHATKPELRFCTFLNPNSNVLDIRDREDLLKWSWFEIRTSAFRWLTIPPKQFIIEKNLIFVVETDIAPESNNLFILKTIFGSSVTRNILTEKKSC